MASREVVRYGKEMIHTHKFEAAQTKYFKSGDKIILNSKYDLGERDLGNVSLEAYIPCGTKGKFIGKEVAINLKTNQIDQETYIVQIPKNNLFLRVNYDLRKYEESLKVFKKQQKKDIKKNKNIIYVGVVDKPFDSEVHLETYYFSKC